MSYIHARKRDGKMVYRFWGNSGGSYYTPEMTLEQMVLWLVEYDLERLTNREGPELLGRLKRANRKGTSCRISAVDERDNPWRESDADEENDLQADDAEKYIGATMEFLLSEDHMGKKDFLVNGKKVRVTVTVELVEQ